MPPKNREDGLLIGSGVVEVEAKPELLDLLNRYVEGLRFCISLFISLNVRSLGEAHRASYKVLRERFGLSSQLATCCYREALAITKSWRELARKRRAKRLPVIKTRRMWLHKRLYAVDWAAGKARICGVEVEVLSVSKSVVRFVSWGWEMREAKLVERGGRLFMWISFQGKPPAIPDVRTERCVAVDVNWREVVYGFPGRIVREPTRAEECIKLREMAEELQARKSHTHYQAFRKKWFRRVWRRIHGRIKGILEDWARQQALRIVRFAVENRCGVIVLEDLKGLKERAEQELPKEWRKRFLFASYRRLHYWIEWLAARHGLAVVKVPPRGTSTTCPRCGARLRSNGHRQMKCPRCGYTGDRDVVAVLNLCKAIQPHP